MSAKSSSSRRRTRGNWRRRRRRLARRSTPREGVEKGAFVARLSPSPQLEMTVSPRRDRKRSARHRTNSSAKPSPRTRRARRRVDRGARLPRPKRRRRRMTSAPRRRTFAPRSWQRAFLCAPRLVARTSSSRRSRRRDSRARLAVRGRRPRRLERVMPRSCAWCFPKIRRTMRRGWIPARSKRCARRKGPGVESWFSSRRTRTKPRKGRFKSSSATATGRSRLPRFEFASPRDFRRAISRRAWRRISVRPTISSAHFRGDSPSDGELRREAV